MKTIITYNLWSAAYAISQGVTLLETVPGYRSGIVLDDTDGNATQAVIAWREHNPLVHGPALVDCYRELISRTREARIA